MLTGFLLGTALLCLFLGLRTIWRAQLKAAAEKMVSSPIPISAGPVTQVMEEHGLPRPSSLMVGMLSLRIAKIPADKKYAKKEGFYLEIPIRRGEAKVEVRYGLETYRGTVNRNVSVGLPGSNDGQGYLTVDLNVQEQRELIVQLEALRKRSYEAVAIEREGKSQQAALTILENLL